jgi:hypothetical protein
VYVFYRASALMTAFTRHCPLREPPVLSFVRLVSVSSRQKSNSRHTAARRRIVMSLVLPTDAPGYKHFGEYDKDSKGSLKRFVAAFKAGKEPKIRDKNVFVRAMKSTFLFAYLNDCTKTIDERKDNICFVFDIIPQIADEQFRSTTFTAVTQKMKESLEVLFQRTREQNLILFESVGALAWRDAFRHHLLNNQNSTLSLICGQTDSTLSAGMLDDLKTIVAEPGFDPNMAYQRHVDLERCGDLKTGAGFRFVGQLIHYSLSHLIEQSSPETLFGLGDLSLIKKKYPREEDRVDEAAWLMTVFDRDRDRLIMTIASDYGEEFHFVYCHECMRAVGCEVEGQCCECDCRLKEPVCRWLMERKVQMPPAFWDKMAYYNLSSFAARLEAIRPESYKLNVPLAAYTKAIRLNRYTFVECMLALKIFTAEQAPTQGLELSESIRRLLAAPETEQRKLDVDALDTLEKLVYEMGESGEILDGPYLKLMNALKDAHTTLHDEMQ